MRATLWLVIGLLLTTSAWCQRSRYDPAQKQPAKQQSNFFDFALGRANPANTDHGCQIDEVRKTLLDATIKTEEWWTALLALGFLVLSLLIILHQQRDRRRRHLIAAALLAQYHNALADARGQTAEARSRHDALADSFNRAQETPRPGDGEPRVQKPQPSGIRAVMLNSDASRGGSAKADSVQAGKPENPPGGEPKVNYAAQIRAMNQKMLSLQQDIDASRKREHAAAEREQNLQQELEQMRRQLAGNANAGS